MVKNAAGLKSIGGYKNSTQQTQYARNAAIMRNRMLQRAARGSDTEEEDSDAGAVTFESPMNDLTLSPSSAGNQSPAATAHNEMRDPSPSVSPTSVTHQTGGVSRRAPSNTELVEQSPIANSESPNRVDATDQLHAERKPSSTPKKSIAPSPTHPVDLIDLTSSDDEADTSALQQQQQQQPPPPPEPTSTFTAGLKKIVIAKRDIRAPDEDASTLFVIKNLDFPRVVYPGLDINCVNLTIPPLVSVYIPAEVDEAKLSKTNITCLALLYQQMNAHKHAFNCWGRMEHAVLMASFCIDGTIGLSSYREIGLCLMSKWRSGVRRHIWVTANMSLTILCVTKCLEELGVDMGVMFIGKLRKDEKTQTYPDGIYVFSSVEDLIKPSIINWLNTQAGDSFGSLCIVDKGICPTVQQPQAEYTEATYSPSQLGSHLRKLLTALDGKMFIIYHNYQIDHPAAIRDMAVTILEPRVGQVFNPHQFRIRKNDYWDMLRSDLINGAQMLSRRIRFSASQILTLMISPINSREKTAEWLDQTPERRVQITSQLVRALNLRSVVPIDGETPLVDVLDEAIRCKDVVDHVLICGFYRSLRDTILAVEALMVKWPRAKMTVIINEASLWDISNITALLDHWNHPNWQAYRISSDFDCLGAEPSLTSSPIPLDTHVFRAFLAEDISLPRSYNVQSRTESIVSRTLGSQKEKITSLEEFVLLLRKRSYNDQVCGIRYLREQIVHDRLQGLNREKIHQSLYWSQSDGVSVTASTSLKSDFLLPKGIAIIQAPRLIKETDLREFYAALAASVGVYNDKAAPIQCGQRISKPYSLLIVFGYGLADALVNSTRLYWSDPINDLMTVILFVDTGTVCMMQTKDLTPNCFPDRDCRAITKEEAFAICRTSNYSRYALSNFQVSENLSTAKLSAVEKQSHAFVGNSFKLIQYLGKVYGPAHFVDGDMTSPTELLSKLRLHRFRQRSTFDAVTISSPLAVGYLSRLMVLHQGCSVCHDLLQQNVVADLAQSIAANRKALFAQAFWTLEFLELASQSAPLLLELALQQYDATSLQSPGQLYKVDPNYCHHMLHRAIAAMGSACHVLPVQQTTIMTDLIRLSHQAWAELVQQHCDWSRRVSESDLNPGAMKNGVKLLENNLGLDVLVLRTYVTSPMEARMKLSEDSAIRAALEKWWLYFNLQNPIYNPHAATRTKAFVHKMLSLAVIQRTHNLVLAQDRKDVYRRSLCPATVVFAVTEQIYCQATWRRYLNCQFGMKETNARETAKNTRTECVSAQPASSSNVIQAPAPAPRGKPIPLNLSRTFKRTAPQIAEPKILPPVAWLPVQPKQSQSRDPSKNQLPNQHAPPQSPRAMGSSCATSLHKPSILDQVCSAHTREAQLNEVSAAIFKVTSPRASPFKGSAPAVPSPGVRLQSPKHGEASAISIRNQCYKSGFPFKNDTTRPPGAAMNTENRSILPKTVLSQPEERNEKKQPASTPIEISESSTQNPNFPRFTTKITGNAPIPETSANGVLRNANMIAGPSARLTESVLHTNAQPTPFEEISRSKTSLDWALPPLQRNHPQSPSALTAGASRAMRIHYHDSNPVFIEERSAVQPNCARRLPIPKQTKSPPLQQETTSHSPNSFSNLTSHKSPTSAEGVSRNTASDTEVIFSSFESTTEQSRQNITHPKTAEVINLIEVDSDASGSSHIVDESDSVEILNPPPKGIEKKLEAKKFVRAHTDADAAQTRLTCDSPKAKLARLNNFPSDRATSAIENAKYDENLPRTGSNEGNIGSYVRNVNQESSEWDSLILGTLQNPQLVFKVCADGTIR